MTITRGEIGQVTCILNVEFPKILQAMELYKSYITENDCENDYNDIGTCDNCGETDTHTYVPTMFSLDEEGINTCFCRDCLEYLVEEKLIDYSIEKMLELYQQTKTYLGKNNNG